MATSIRFLTYDPIELEAEMPFSIDLDGFVIPEQTVFLQVYADPDNTLPVFFVEPNAFSAFGGVLVTPGQATQIGPFLRADIPVFYCEAEAAILVTIIPVVSER